MLTTNDIRVNGYPPLETVLAHFDAIPILIEALRRADPAALRAWDDARNAARPARRIVSASPSGEKFLNPDPAYSGFVDSFE